MVQCFSLRNIRCTFFSCSFCTCPWPVCGSQGSVTYSTQCKTIYFRAPLNIESVPWLLLSIESVPGLLLCDSAAGTSHGNPKCVFLTYEGFIIRECISISLLPPSGSDGNSSTSGPHLYSSCAAVPLPLSTVQLFFFHQRTSTSKHTHIVKQCSGKSYSCANSHVVLQILLMSVFEFAGCLDMLIDRYRLLHSHSFYTVTLQFLTGLHTRQVLHHLTEEY